MFLIISETYPLLHILVKKSNILKVGKLCNPLSFVHFYQIIIDLKIRINSQ